MSKIEAYIFLAYPVVLYQVLSTLHSQGFDSLTYGDQPRKQLDHRQTPPYFSELASLTVLDISSNKFEGRFSTKISRLKNLRVPYFLCD
jgi:hypothetical protein